MKSIIFHLLSLASVVAQSMPQGTVVIPPDASIYGPAIYVEDKSMAGFEKVEIKDRPFSNALRLTVRKPAAEAWQIGVAAKTVAPIKKGDVLWLTLQARTIQSIEETGESYADAVLLMKNEAGKEVRPLERRFTCGPEWTETSIPFVVASDAAAGEAKLVIRYGGAAQSLEVGGITVINCGPGADLTKLPKVGGRYVGFAADAPWRAAAAARIEQLRKGDFPIRVVDASGKPVADAKVSVRMIRHAFPWATAVNAKQIASKGIEADERYRKIVETYFNKGVLANDMKWGRIINQKPGAKQDIADALAWFKAREMPVRGTILVWPSWQYTPPFLRLLEKDPAALRNTVANHITSMTTNYKGEFADWDVINETYKHNDLLKILGRDVMVDWLKLARAGDPAAKLYYNDYIMFHGTTPDAPSQYLYDLIKFFKDKGAEIDGIGEQAHFIGIPPGPAELVATLDRFGKLGLPIQITEFDIETPDEQLQADFTRDFLTAAFSHPSVNGIVHWEFWENPEGKPDACLWRKDGSIREPGKVWVDLTTKQWWTNADGKTAADGTYATRGFYGDYEVTVSQGARTKTTRLKLQPGAAVQSISLSE